MTSSIPILCPHCKHKSRVDIVQRIEQVDMLITEAQCARCHSPYWSRTTMYEGDSR